MFPSYAELHCLTNFSFLRGASHPEELVERAKKLGYSALAITDECSLAGVVRAHVAAKEAGLGLIIGAEFTLCAEPGALRLVLLATSREGYGNLSELITRGRRQAKKGEYRLTRADLDDGLAECLALLLPAAEPNLDDAVWLKARFPQGAWIAAELLYGSDDRARLAQLEQLSTESGLPLVAAGDVHMHVRARRALQDTLTAVRLKQPVKECGHALFPNGERHLRSLERLVRIYPPELLIETLNVAQRCSFSLDSLRYEYPEEIVPAGETPSSWLHKLAQEGFRWRFGHQLSDASCQSSDGEQHESRFSKGWGSRFTSGQKEDIDKARALVKHELQLIAELQYEPYFLTVYDIVRVAREKGILCQGRGSAANSALCYCLGITEVDPARMEMLFERFLSKERNEPPDIDVDFEHERREEVIQYIYEKYGRDRAALTATVISYRPKSALRDVGKALGLDLAQVDRLAKTLAWWDGRRVREERLREAGFNPDNRVIQRLIALVEIIVGFPRHLSQHVGGFVISRGPLSRLVPIENAAMVERLWKTEQGSRSAGCDPGTGAKRAESGTTGVSRASTVTSPQAGPLFQASARLWKAEQGSRSAGCDPETGDKRAESGTTGVSRASTVTSPQAGPLFQASARTVIQWDKDDLDALKLLKVDVLALGMLTAIRRALDLISGYRGEPLDISGIPPEDAGVYEMIGHGDTIGVFQIESRAQQSMLPRMRPTCFYDLVVEVAIVRPGPIQGGMVHPYLRRRQGIEPVTYPSEAVRKVLERTLGVPIFQEQVMHLAIVAAGFTPGEADRLRRAMAAWKKRGGLEPFEQRLKDGMRERGYSGEFADQIFRQILGFGEYGFPESHSASFALLVYVSSWLKRYEPAAFTCALLNSQPMGFYAPSQLAQDAQRHGVEIRPADVVVSEWDCTLEPAPGDFQPAIRLGLRMVKGFSEEAAKRLLDARKAFRVSGASSLTVESLAHAANLNRHDMNALAAAGALASLSGHRRQAVWAVTGIEPRPPVLHNAPILDPTPPLPAPSEGQDLVADYASLGLTLGRHPVALLRPRLDSLRMTTAAQLRQMPHGKLTRAAGIVIGRQRPDTASGVIFVTLEDETGMVNVVVWQGVAQRQRRALLGSQLLAVHGVVEREGEVVHLVAGKLVDHSALLGRLLTRSRDFH